MHDSQKSFPVFLHLELIEVILGEIFIHLNYILEYFTSILDVGH